LIGGATTSKIHTAVKIATQYKNPVIHVKDASRAVGVVSNLLSGNEDFLKEIRDDYQAVRDLHGQKKAKKYLSIEEARANRLKIDWENTPIYKPNVVGVKQLINYPISELRKYIDWTFFFFVWELKGKFPDIRNDELQG
jgi:5-methyltetrahydrofolate--homocysteine methyltransferase